MKKILFIFGFVLTSCEASDVEKLNKLESPVVVKTKGRVGFFGNGIIVIDKKGTAEYFSNGAFKSAEVGDTIK